MNRPETSTPPPENLWLNIGLNVLLPSVLMTKGKDWLGLEPAWLLVVALAFPVSYGIYDFIARKKCNFFSILGFVSILISGGVGLLQLDKDWIAVKEAAIPALFAIAVLVSLKTPYPLVRTFLYNPQLFDVQKVETALQKKQNLSAFERLMVRCTVYLAGSFVLSAVLNFALAKYFIRSETGTDEFVKEMGAMTAWSWPVITLPSTIVMFIALMTLIKGIHRYTGYDMEEVLIAGQKPSATDSTSTNTPDGSATD
jgi:intracellular septation protein A